MKKHIVMHKHVPTFAYIAFLPPLPPLPLPHCLIRLITAFLSKTESFLEVGYTHPTFGVLIFVLILSDRQVHGWLLLLTLESDK